MRVFLYTITILTLFSCTGTIQVYDAGSPDATVDAGADAGEDAGTDAGVEDAGTDAGVDAGQDAGADLDPGTSLLDRLETVSLTVSAGVKSGVNNWRIWGSSSLKIAPVFTVPLANCETLVGYTGGGGDALAVRLDAGDQQVASLELGSGYELRGLAAEPDGHFAALIWDGSADEIFVRRFQFDGTEVWTEELINTSNNPTDFGIGESRLEFGGGKYGAYYHVHSLDGHEGDTLKWVTSAGGESTEWSWGCSHSMSNLLRFHPALGDFLPVCVTDCYPGTSGIFLTNSQGGIYLNHNDGKVIDVDAGCNGRVAGEIGSAALTPVGWALTFNAHQNPMTTGQNSYDSSSMNQDIGFSTVNSNLDATPVVWLTDTSSIDEADSTIARWQPVGDPLEQYVVGWSEPGSSYNWLLARVDAQGNFLEGPLDVSSRAQWGRRDDPMRRHFNGDVVWAWFESAGSATLHFARLRSGGSYDCVTFP